jgi:hypothetical protein
VQTKLIYPLGRSTMLKSQWWFCCSSSSPSNSRETKMTGKDLSTFATCTVYIPFKVTMYVCASVPRCSLVYLLIATPLPHGQQGQE